MNPALKKYFSSPSSCLFSCGDDKSEATLQALKDSWQVLNSQKKENKQTQKHQPNMIELGPGRKENREKQANSLKHQKKISIKGLLNTLEINKLAKTSSRKTSQISTDNQAKPMVHRPITFSNSLKEYQLNLEYPYQRVAGKENDNKLWHDQVLPFNSSHKKTIKRREERISRQTNNYWMNGAQKRQGNRYSFQSKDMEYIQAKDPSNRKLLKLGQNLPTLRSFEQKTRRINAQEMELLFL